MSYKQDCDEIIMGIDPSINSTGICILYKKDERIVYSPEYYLIVSKTTKKMREFNYELVKILPYDYVSSTGLKSFEKEHSKSLNVYNICKIIKEIILKHGPSKIYMEAVAFAANGTIDQLAGLNYSIRNIALDLDINIIVVPPTTIKMLSVGNGQATKDVIIDTWKNLDYKTFDVCDHYKIKCDDLADAYMMANLNI